MKDSPLPPQRHLIFLPSRRVARTTNIFQIINKFFVVISSITIVTKTIVTSHANDANSFKNHLTIHQVKMTSVTNTKTDDIFVERFV